jgi:hypothetical protein
MEEAATPLPSEETTPPVTNIYFGAIRVVRAATASALDCSYLSGALLKCTAGSTYTQLWARDAPLSIATLCVDKCKFFIHAETFSAQKGSNFARVLPGPGADSSGTHTVGTETAATTPPSKLGRYCKARSFVWLCHAPFWRGAGFGALSPDIVLTTAPSLWASIGVN